MKFSDPYLLNLLWLIIAAFGVVFYGMHQRKKIVTAFTRLDLMDNIMSGYSPERRWIRACLILFALSLGIIALSGPLAGFRWEKIEQKGVDIMITLDCSKSMLAQDIKPSRLARAKHEIIDLLRMMTQDRAGLVAFSGKAILQCPLTLDHEAFHIFLNVLEPGFLPMGGTNLADAVRTAWSGFEKDSNTDKAIILITDGENTGGDVEAAAKEMAEHGVKIFAIGVGDVAGAPIPDENGGFTKDSQGRIVMSKVDETILKKIASLTGGTYVRSVAGDMDLDLIYKDKIRGTMEKKTVSSGRKKVWENRFQWFLLPCIIILLVEFLIPSSGKRKGKGVFTAVLAGVFAFGLMNASVVHAGVASDVKEGITAFEQGSWEDAKKHFIDAQLKDPDNEKLYYNIGAAAYMNEEFEMAKNSFLQAAQTRDRQLKQKSMFNLANTYYRQGKLDDAVKAYEQLLKQFPEDEQAKENLEFVKQQKQQQKQQPQSDKNQAGKPGQDQNKDPSQQKNQPSKEGQKPGQDQKKEADSDSGKDEQQSGKSQPENKDPENKDKSGQKNKTDQQPENKQQTAGKKGSPKQQGNVNPEKTGPKGQNEQAASAQARGNQQERAAGSSLLEHKLNRLEDKPGRALMPENTGRTPEKDW